MKIGKIVKYLIAETRSRSLLEVSHKKVVTFFKCGAVYKQLVNPNALSSDVKKQLTPSSVIIQKKPEAFFSAPVERQFGVVFFEGSRNSDKKIEEGIKNSLRYIDDDGFVVIRHSYPKSESQQMPLSFLQKIKSEDKSWCGEVWKTIVKLRIERKDIGVFTINSGYGITVIYNCATEAECNVSALPSYQEFSADVASFLNLKEPEWFIQWLATRKEQKIPKFYTETPFTDMKKYAYNRCIYSDIRGDTIVENGVMLPLRTLTTRKPILFEGGVCDSKLQFVAGFMSGIYDNKFKNLSCISSYHVSASDIATVDESVVFAGILQKYFGHILFDSISRWWWFVKHPQYTGKIAFLSSVSKNDKLYFLQMELLSRLGIDTNRVVIVDKPTRFKKIIVPEQSVYRIDAYHKDFIQPFNIIRDSVKPGSIEKIYFTRRFLHKSDTINEEYFESFYTRQGYTVVAPEKLTIEEQISLIAGAKEFACLQGTLSHLMLFAKDKTKITILRRTQDIVGAQISVNQIRNLDVTYVDISANFLPTSHIFGPFMLTATSCWKQYVLDNYPNEDVEVSDKAFHPYIVEYITKWVDKYKSVNLFSFFLVKKNSIDFLESLAKYFGNSQIDRNNLQKELEFFQNENPKKKGHRSVTTQ